MQNPPKSYSSTERALAWGVHVYTAVGVVFALLAIIAISDHDFRMAFVWLIAAFIVDGTDGLLARKFNVSEVLPNMKGKNIDFVIDFANYAIIPGYFYYEAFWTANEEIIYLLPGGENLRIAAVALLLLVSAVYYGKEPMVSKDMYFIGFPVLWNAVAYFSFFVTQWHPWVNFGLVVLFSILHFVPIKVAYPSQNKKYQFLNWFMGLVFLVSNAYLLWIYPEAPLWLRICSGIYLPYFVVFTAWATFKKS